MDYAGIIIQIVLLVGLSAVCSGLNLALLSLEVSDLERRAKYGNRRARVVLPLRKNAHLSLAAILLTNVAMVSATSLVLEAHFNGWVAGIVSTILIVIFGEIFPQAIFRKDALKVCAIFAPLLKLMIILTYPVSKPLQLLLDRLFGKEQSRLHSRNELGMIIREHRESDASELDEDEAEIMYGAINLSYKRVRGIMTDIRHVYWLTPETKLTPKKIDEIKRESWSRIPIFNEALDYCYGVLLMKDMVDVDFDEHTYRVSDFRLRETKLVGSMTALDTVFKMFIAAHSHLMPVVRGKQIVGIVTIEDLIEEILGHEIEDESDQAAQPGGSGLVNPNPEN